MRIILTVIFLQDTGTTGHGDGDTVSSTGHGDGDSVLDVGEGRGG